MKNLSFKLLSHDAMLKLGFRKIDSLMIYYFIKTVGSDSINRETLNISIPFDKRGREFSIDVIDESFLQPCDYEYLLSLDGNQDNKYLRGIESNVNKIIDSFIDAGLLIEIQ